MLVELLALRKLTPALYIRVKYGWLHSKVSSISREAATCSLAIV